MMQGADLALIGGRVRTGNRAAPTASAIAIKNGRILAVGSDAQILAHCGPKTRVRDLAGAVLYPGFVDVHNHHADAGRALLFELQFSPQLSIDEILDEVRRHAATLPEDAWIVGGTFPGPMQSTLSSTAMRERLDAASGGRPTMLMEHTWHNRWVNSKALELAGIHAGSVPAKGVTLLDENDGTPTGILQEEAGTPVVEAHTRDSRLSSDDHRRASRRGIEVLSSVGVTAFQDAAASREIMASLSSLDRAGELNAWAVSSIAINDTIFGYDLVGEPLIALGEGYRTTHHRPDFVKIFLDGVPAARTAAFREPYLEDVQHGRCHHGKTIMDSAELYGWLHHVVSRGLGAKVHCTGDATGGLLLDVVQRLRNEGFQDAKFQIAHGQYVSEDDISRMHELRVDLDASPFVWFPGMVADTLRGVRGPCADHSSPHRSLLDHGVRVGVGSDWPVSESPNPFEGLQGLITRADPLGRFPGTLWPEQAMTPEEALRACTLTAAEMMGLENETGSIELGKSADFIVLSCDPLAGPTESIIDTTVIETWFAGKAVFLAH